MIFEIIITPLQLMMECFLIFFHSCTGSWGFSLVLLSLAITLITWPLQSIADKIRKREENLEALMHDEIELIKRNFTGIKKSELIGVVYRRHNYHPLMALRGICGLFLLIPFFCAAYFMLSEFQDYQGVSFGMVKDLSKPDALIQGINFLPVMMLLASIANIFIAWKLSKTEFKWKMQAVMSALFFVLLYKMPSALVIYWTMNSIWGITKLLLTRYLENTRLAKFKSIFEYPTAWILKIFNIISKPPVFVALWAGLFSALYLYSRNWFILNSKELASAVAWSVIPLLLIAIALDLLGRLVIKYGFKNIRNKLTLRCKYYLIFGIGLLLLFLRYNIFLELAEFIPYFQGKSGDSSLIVSGILLILFTFWLRKRDVFKVTQNFNKVLIVCSALLFLSSVLHPKLTDPLEIHGSTVTPSKEIQDLDFKEKPNIYIVILESMTSPATFKSIYNYDINPFLSELKDRNFKISDDMMSSYPNTITSMQGMFSMRHHYFFNEMGMDNTAARGIVSGNLYNPVYHAFKKNGYKIQVGWPGTSMFQDAFKNAQKDNTFSIDKLYYLSDMVWKVKPPLMFRLAKTFKKLVIGKQVTIQKVKKGSKVTTKKFWNRSINWSKENNPVLTIVKINDTFHSDSRLALDLRNASSVSSLKKFEKVYCDAVSKANPKRLVDVDRIIANDPNAIVILIGDHGARRYRSAIEILAETGKWPECIPEPKDKTVARDYLGIFFAIRIPDKKLKFTMPQGTADLFVSLINTLTQKNILERPEPLHFLKKGWVVDSSKGEKIKVEHKPSLNLN